MENNQERLEFVSTIMRLKLIQEQPICTSFLKYWREGKTEEVVSKKENVIKYGVQSGKEEYVVTHDPFDSTHTIRPYMCTNSRHVFSHNLTPSTLYDPTCVQFSLVLISCPSHGFISTHFSQMLGYAKQIFKWVYRLLSFSNFCWNGWAKSWWHFSATKEKYWRG